MQRQTNVRQATETAAARSPGALVLAPLMVGVAAVVVLVNASGVGAALFQNLRARRRGDEPNLRRMRRALMGRAQSQVAELLGPPPTAANDRSATVHTWYYPVGNRRQYAMAIRFDHGRAESVDFVPA